MYYNLYTNKQFTGKNLDILESTGLEGGFCTFNQARKMGAQVIKGSKAVAKLSRMVQDGKETEFRSYPVFHESQIQKKEDKQIELTEEQFRNLSDNKNTPDSTCWDWNYGKKAPSADSSDFLCPIFGDYIPYKSWTIVVEKQYLESARNWCNYFHGGGSVEKEKQVSSNKIAIRSNYLCW